MKSQISNIFDFFRLAEKLKTEIRHSWTSNTERQESVAEHTWMMLLMAFILMDKVGVKLDKFRVLRMIISHDLVEVLARDVPSHELSERQDHKEDKERKAICDMTSMLDKKIANEIVALWEEFEVRKTPEAKFAYALDKFECLFQHDIADIKTWDEGDFRYTFVDKQDTPFDFNKFMRELKDRLDDWTYKKVEEAGFLERIPDKNLERYKNRGR